MSRIWIQLGRHGDILNILPLLYADAQEHGRQRLMIAKDYAGLLEGCSYVEPLIFDGGAHEIDRAIKQVQASGQEYICTQVNGPTPIVEEWVYKPAGLTHAVTASYQKEMWKIAGRLGEWGTQLPHPHGQHSLVFDRPNIERQEKLLEQLPKRKFVLVAADGISSPFRYKPLLLALLKQCGYAVVDLSSIKAERLFDLIPVLEKALCLVAIDSAPLHLANAVPELPVLALVNDKPRTWNGSAWRSNHVWYCRYSDFPDRAVEMLDVIRSVKPEKWKPKIIHLFNGLNGESIDCPKSQYWVPFPIRPGVIGRVGPDGEPVLLDAIKMACQRAQANGQVVLTRPGVKLAKAIEDTLGLSGPCFAYRLVESPEGPTFSPIVDLFCAGAMWWQEHYQDIPLLYLSSDYFWSDALWSIFKNAGAEDLTGVVSRIPTAPKAAAELSAVTRHNLLGRNAVYKSLTITSRYPEVSEQLKTVPIVRLPPFAYNPSICQIGSKVWIAYRYHATTGDLNTRLGLSEVVNGVAINPRDLDLGGEGVEDPRLFRFHGGMSMSWVETRQVRSPSASSVVKYGHLVSEFQADDKPPLLSFKPVYQIDAGDNQGGGLQKNWCFFEQDENLMCVYRSRPEQTIFRVQGAKVTNEHRSPDPRWPYGELRGGVILPWGDKLLRFFHSSIDAGAQRRYFIGACLMNATPPYEVSAIGSRPILYGSEIDDLRVKDRPFHWKANVVIPGGAIEDKDGWLLAVGVNDSACAVVRVTEKDLRL